MGNDKRVILIGFDAGILRSVNHFIDDLPNFARLIKEGVSCEARPSMPADTPTNWTTIATGAYSSTHGIFSFNNDIGRIQGRAPVVELAETFGSKQNKAEYIWQAAERSGKKMILIHYPIAWPWTVKDSIAVGGCGVSSALWQLAGPAMYSNDDRGTEKIELKKADNTDAEKLFSPVLKAVLPIVSGKKFSWSAFGQEELADENLDTPGVSDFIVHWANDTPPEVKFDFKNSEQFLYHLSVHNSNGNGYDKVLVYKNKSDSSPLAELIPGKWVGPVYDSFSTESGQTESFYYLKLHELSTDGKTIRICRTNITRTSGYTYPDKIAEELKQAGCPLQGNLENAVTIMKTQYYFDDNWKDLYLIPEVCQLQTDKLADTAKYLLNKYDWDISYIQVHIPDGLNHTLGAYLHPDAEKFTTKENIDRAYDIFKKTYQTMDKMLGRIWQQCSKDEDVIAVVSDHGSVGAWRYACIQSYLVQGGFMKLKAIPSPQFGNRYVVDMENSKVFMGEHLHINLKGKYPAGIVETKDYETVQDELIEYLNNCTDPENGEKIFSHVLKKEDAGYLGIDCDYVGDVVYFLKPGYYPTITNINYFIPEAYKEIISEEKVKTAPGATHPYHPDIPCGIMSTNAMFFIAGPGIKKNYQKKESIHLADVVPTLAFIAGIDEPANTDGQIITDFLEIEP